MTQTQINREMIWKRKREEEIKKWKTRFGRGVRVPANPQLRPFLLYLFIRLCTRLPFFPFSSFHLFLSLYTHLLPIIISTCCLHRHRHTDRIIHHHPYLATSTHTTNALTRISTLNWQIKWTQGRELTLRVMVLFIYTWMLGKRKKEHTVQHFGHGM